jgi:metal-responsive CopG/Arc/MetJ family transcriptional regulator
MNEEMVGLGIRIPKKLKEEMDSYLDKHDMIANRFCNKAITMYLEQKKGEDDVN